MDRCLKHPDRETPYRCMKHEIAMCKECLHCRDPEIYCKFRTSCAIHFIEKRGGSAPAEPGRPEKASAEP